MQVIKILSENYNLRGLKGKLLLVQLDTIPHTPPELYIRSGGVDPDWVSRLRSLIEEGTDLDPIVVAFVKEVGKEVLVGGNHRIEAYKGLTNEVKVLYIGEINIETFFLLQRELNPDVLPMKTEDLRRYSEVLYDHLKEKYQGQELYERIAEIAGRSMETVRKWLVEKIQREKQEKIRKAIELREKGLSLREIAEELDMTPEGVRKLLSTFGKVYQKLTLLTPTSEPTPEGIKLFDEYLSEMDRLPPAWNHSVFARWLEGKEIKVEGSLEEFVRAFTSVMGQAFNHFASMGETDYGKVMRYLEGKDPIRKLKNRKKLLEWGGRFYLDRVEKVERERSILEELKRRALEPEVPNIDSLPRSEEERKVLRKYYVQVLEEFRKLKTAKVEDLEGQFGSEKELEEWLIRHGYRTYNTGSLYQELVRRREERRRIEELKDILRSSYYSSVAEFEESVSEEDRKLVARYADEFVSVIGQKDKATPDEHEALAKKVVEEGISEEEARAYAWREWRKIVSVRLLREYVDKIRSEKRRMEEEERIERELEKAFEEIGKEEGKKESGITIVGVIRESGKALEKIEEAQKEIEEVLEALVKEGNPLVKKLKDALAQLEQGKETIEKMRKKAQITEERKSRNGIKHGDLTREVVRNILSYSASVLKRPLKEDWGKLMRMTDRAVDEYLYVSGYDPVNDREKILSAFVETFHYAKLRYNPTLEFFFRKFVDYRNEIRGRDFPVRTPEGKFTSLSDIRETVRRFMEERGSARSS